MLSLRLTTRSSVLGFALALPWVGLVATASAQGAPPTPGPSAPSPPPAAPPPATPAAPPSAGQPGAAPGAPPYNPPPDTAPAAPPNAAQPAPPATPTFQPAPSPLLPPSAPPAPGAAPTYPQPYPQQPYYEPYAPSPGYAAPYSYPYSQRRGPEPGARAHDGFFLRFNLGVGAGGASYEEQLEGAPDVSDVVTRGVSGTFQLAIGGSLVENFILHGNMAVTGVSARKEIDEIEDRSYDDLSTNMWLFGAGATYYFMPTNIYLTWVLGASALTERREADSLDEDEPDTDYIDSDAGFGTTLSVGKEWWVGRRGEWGIGASLTGGFYAAPVDIRGVESTFMAHNVSLNFSATLN